MRRGGCGMLVLWAACTAPNPLFLGSAGDGSGDATTTSAAATTTTSSTGAATASTGSSTTGSGSGGETTPPPTTSSTSGVVTTGSSGSSDGSSGSDGTGGPAPITCPPDPTLVGCYHFPVGELDKLVDGSPHGNDGEMTIDGLTPAPPAFEVAAALGPTSALLVHETGVNDALDLTTAITMTALVYLAELPPAGARVGVLDKDGQYSLFVHSDGDLRCQVADFIEPTGVTLPVGAWVHVACSFDGATIRVYLDGVEAAAIPKAGVLQSVDLGDLVLGGNSPLPDERMIGALDAVEIWSVPLAPASICERAGPACP